MKIRQIETIFVDQYMFVKIHTDGGITGLGESGAWGFLEASAAAVETFGRYLVGQDPLRIEHHWQYLYRYSHFRGAAVMGALSAIDIALWDIAGKHFGVPVWQLLGGKTRDKVRVYVHVKAPTKEKLVNLCIERKEAGFNAVGHLTPFLDDSRDIPYFKTHAHCIDDAVATVARYREVLGNDVDICLELHRRMSPSDAIVLAREIEQYRPFFYEDPIRPDNLDEMATVARKIRIPLATGERLHGVHEFAMLIKRGAVDYLRFSVCAAGGISAGKKVAGMAEGSYIRIVPHNPLSPVSTAACVQLDACITNLGIQEYPNIESESPFSQMVKQPLEVKDGYLIVPNRPGIGVELVDDAAERFPYKPRTVRTRLGTDGSIVDQ